MQLEYGPIIKKIILLKKQLEYDRYIHAQAFQCKNTNITTNPADRICIF